MQEYLEEQRMTTENLDLKPTVRDTAMLVLQQGAESSKRWALSRAKTVTIGRNDDCEVVLPDRQVSRYHARITWNNDHYEIVDLGSKNGTHVNGQLTESSTIKRRVRFGSMANKLIPR